MQNLFSTHQLGGITLNNRIVMAPMTRSRAVNNIPNELMADYYAQRATAGLIITEGTSPSHNGLGYARIPGIFSEEQVEAWKQVTDAVHHKGGRIFLQIMHTGRVSHPDNFPAGGKVIAPSAVPLKTTKMWVDGRGLLDIPVATPLTTAEVKEVIAEHVRAAERAIAAGFDGVELHGANGYLIKQFLNPHTNRRDDIYGGSVENRSRFLLEIAEGVVEAIGKEKVGVRISPFSQVNETPAYPEAQSTYLYIGRKLNDLGITYLHVTDNAVKGQPDALTQHLRQIFTNTLILSGGYSANSAEEVLESDLADLVSFARPFIPNPDLVSRFKNKLPLNQPKFELFYTPGREGYVDYPVFEDVQVV
ncbi:MAG TPA: alkene reductase [Chryseosolibacter sp.]|nr:alkene reductase [Chryseosolibacter sp.]